MARKVKRKRTAQKRKTARRVRQKKTSKNSSYLALIIVIILFVFAIYYFIGKQSQQPYQQPYQQPSGTTPTTSGQGAAASVGGFCKTNYECYVTSCKGQTEDCINATQMATYANDKCRTYSDWNNVKQDKSRCACLKNACTMIG